MVEQAERPTSLHGCWQSWAETDAPSIIRTQSDSGHIKVRRRTTGVRRTASVSAVYPAARYDDVMVWFRVLTAQGVKATNIVEPSGVETYWRFTRPPQIDWVNAEAFRMTAEIERNETWP